MGSGEMSSWEQFQSDAAVNRQHTHTDDGSVEGCPGCFPGSEVVRWADRAMWEATPDEMAAAGEEVLPRVTLVTMTPNPLRAMAAASDMYKGKPRHDPSEMSRTVALEWWEEMTKTVLHAPLEFIDLHFLFEGVTRAWANQLERQRTAVYVQESLRFAVKTNAALEVAKPYSILSLKEDDPKRVIWDTAVGYVAGVYMQLVNAGIAAEDARGLLPLNITTRVHYKTNLRNLAEHAGLRLCSQAQEEWKLVWVGILDAIRNYGAPVDRWQQNAIANLFRPICYQTGRCEFRGANDRYCPIRERVESHHARGEGPETWTDINPAEAMMPGAARRAPGDPS
jgi:flavin-dependent thymidylate synthase